MYGGGFVYFQNRLESLVHVVSAMRLVYLGASSLLCIGHAAGEFMRVDRWLAEEGPLGHVSLLIVVCP